MARPEYAPVGRADEEAFTRSGVFSCVEGDRQQPHFNLNFPLGDAEAG